MCALCVANLDTLGVTLSIPKHDKSGSPHLQTGLNLGSMHNEWSLTLLLKTQGNGWGGSQYSDNEPAQDGLQSELEGEDDVSEIICVHAMHITENKINSPPMICLMCITVEDVPDAEDLLGCSDDEWVSCESKLDKETGPIHLWVMHTMKGGTLIEFRSTVCWCGAPVTAQPNHNATQNAVLCGMV